MSPSTPPSLKLASSTGGASSESDGAEAATLSSVAARASAPDDESGESGVRGVDESDGDEGSWDRVCRQTEGVSGTARQGSEHGRRAG